MRVLVLTGMAVLVTAWPVMASPGDALRRIDRDLAACPIAGDTVHAVATMVQGSPGDPWHETAEGVRIVDRRGRILFSDSIDIHITPDGTIDGQCVPEAHVFRWPGGAAGIRIDLEYAPDYPPPWVGPCRYFAQRGTQIEAVTPWCNVCNGPDSRGVVHAELWAQDYFMVSIPASIRIDRAGGGLDLNPEKDRSSGLCALEIIRDHGALDRRYDEATYIDYQRGRGPDQEGNYHPHFYRRPAGGAFDSVSVSSRSRVQFGRVYAKIETVLVSGAPSYQTFVVKIARLEVTIDGRHGFVDEGEMYMLGLSPL